MPRVNTNPPETFSFTVNFAPGSHGDVEGAITDQAVEVIAKWYASMWKSRDTLRSIKVHVSATIDGPDAECRLMGTVGRQSDVIVWERSASKDVLAHEKSAEKVNDALVTVEEDPSYDEASLAQLVRYPQIARRNAIEGIVIVAALIGVKGCLERCKVYKSDHDILNRAAMDAVLCTRFSPAKRNGKPIRSWALIPIRFKLR